MCRPGKRPVRVPAIRPRMRAREISSNINQLVK